METDYSQQFIRHVPPDLKAKLIEEAEAQASNMNDVAVRILAKRFKVKVDQGNGTRKTTPSPEGTDMMLRLPTELHTAIKFAAVGSGRTAPREILHALCIAFKVELPPLPKRTRNRGRAQAAA